MSCEKVFRQILSQGYLKVNSSIYIHSTRVLAVRSPWSCNIFIDYLDECGDVRRTVHEPSGVLLRPELNLSPPAYWW